MARPIPRRPAAGAARAPAPGRNANLAAIVRAAAKPKVEATRRARKKPTAEAPARGPETEVRGAVAAPVRAGAKPAERKPTAVDGLLLPEPPAALSPRAQRRVAGVRARAAAKSTATATMPASDEQVRGAREAVATPIEERQARADDALVAALGARPAPDPKIVELCERIRQVIREKRPPDEDSLVDAKPGEMAREAGGEVGAGAEAAIDQVEGNYDALQERPAAPTEPAPPAIPEIPDAPASPGLDAAAATPDAIPPADMSLDADVRAQQARFDEAGMNTEPAKLVRSGPIAAARQAIGELSGLAESDAVAAAEAERAARERASADLVALQEQAIAALTSGRMDSAKASAAQQSAMVGSEEQLRASTMKELNELFVSTQSQVRGLLNGLTRHAMDWWDREVAEHSRTFESELSGIADSIRERHSGGLGWLRRGVDWATGLPAWVTRRYDKAELEFANSLCDLAKEISAYVNGIVLACEKLIDDAEAKGKEIFERVAQRLPEWAAEQQKLFDGRLKGLRDEARNTRNEFNARLVERASQAVQEAREKLEVLRQKARGFVQKVATFVADFVNDPVRTLINGLLDVVGIARGAFWAVVRRIGEVVSDIARDPLGFARKLLRGVGEGFDAFFKSFPRYLMDGLVQWLFKGLGNVGVEVPRDFSLPSVITFLLQLMGLSWARVKRLIAKRIGERNVALIEKAWEYLSTFIREGPRGIYALIKDQLNPRTILDQILRTVRDAVVESIVVNVAKRVLLLFNPVGAILTAIEAIYRVLKWIFQNAARLFSLIEAVVNGMAAIVAGNVSAMARAVERALAGLIGPVIGFFADYFGLGNIPEKIGKLIGRMQSWIEGLLDRVIGWVVSMVRRGLQATRGAVRRLVSWWRERKRVRGADGKDHHVYFKGSGRSATLMVASEPTPFARFIEEAPEPSSREKSAKAEARRLASQMDGIIAAGGADGSLDEAQLAALEKVWDDLARKIAVLFPAKVKSGEPVYGRLTNEGYGTSMVVMPLTSELEGGSVPSVAHTASYKHLNFRRKGSGSYYILGHLLNHNVGGPGNKWENLTPLSRKANSAHEKLIESDVKKAIEAGKHLRYEVFAIYGRAVNRALLDALDGSAHPHGGRLKNIVAAEAFIPSKLTIRAKEIEGGKKGGTRLDKTLEVENTIEDSAVSHYEFDGGPRLTKLGINEAIRQGDVEALQMLPGIGPAIARQLVADRKQFSSWDAVSVAGLRQAELNRWRDPQAIPNVVVTLHGAVVRE